MRGVTNVISGYSGGTTDTPSYEEVSTGSTGHAEVVSVTFNEEEIPASIILDLFFLIHNPTTLNRQGADVGTQYRSVLFYADESQKAAFTGALQRAASHWDDPLVTELTPLKGFYPAEAYHQDYFNKHPEAGYCQVVIAPKVMKVRSTYTKWLTT